MTSSDSVALRRPQPFGGGHRHEEGRGPHNWMQIVHVHEQFWLNGSIYLSAIRGCRFHLKFAGSLFKNGGKRKDRSPSKRPRYGSSR